MQREVQSSDGELYENELASIIVDCSYHMYVELESGLFESAYEEIMFHELTPIGLKVEKQKALPVIWKGKTMDIGFRTDLIVEEKVIVELKSVEQIAPVHSKQLLTYLK